MLKGDLLEAGYKINIDGTYTEAVGVNLTGTITGSTWLGERIISFDFDENGSSAADDGNGGDNGNNDTPGNAEGFPAVGSTYQGCYVLKSIVADDGQSAELTLLSPNKTTIGKAYNDASFIGHPEVLEALVDEKLAEAGVDGISDWRLPTYNELNSIYTALDANDNTVKERIFENIPVTRNQITRYIGSFFGSGGGQTSDGTFRLTADPDWDSVNGYTF